MPRRSRRQRWALVVTAVAGTIVGTAAAAQPADHHPPPTSTTRPSVVPTTTTEGPGTPVAPTSTVPDDDDDDGAPSPVSDDGGATGGPTGAGVPAPANPAPAAPDTGDHRDGGDRGGDNEMALPTAEWLFSDGRALMAPPAEIPGDTRPVWLAVLLGLGAGVGLTAAASVVVNNLDPACPE